MAKPKTALFTYNGGPFIVVAKKAMHRGGRHWSAGVHEFVTKEQLEALGDEETIGKMLSTIALYPGDFDIKTAAPPPKQQQE